MEVVVSAAVLILVVLGVMAAIDSATGTAGANKARTVAATLAEKDQEELRSLRTSDLNTLETLIPEPREVDVAGVPYTITSDAEWVTDAKGEDISCALESGEGSFLRITSKVTSPMTGARVKPVVMTSIVAPEPGSGTLTASVTNAEGQAVTNLPVHASGPENKTVQTNEAGCAVFGAMEAGAYEVKVDQSGWVDPEGVQEVIKSATVAAGTLATADFVYDIAATLTVNLQSAPTLGPQVDNSYGVIAGHTGIATNFRLFPSAATLSQQHVLDGLFPFRDAYKIFSARCADADPIGWESAYFDLLNLPEEGPFDATPELEPGEERTITISEPAINVIATFSRTINNSRVYAYPRNPTCAGPTQMDLGRVMAGGKAEFPGVPFGTYDVCVQFQRVSPDLRWYYRRVNGVDNTSSTGTAPQTIAVVTGTSPTVQDSCPAT